MSYKMPCFKRYYFDLAGNAYSRWTGRKLKHGKGGKPHYMLQDDKDINHRVRVDEIIQWGKHLMAIGELPCDENVTLKDFFK